MLRHHAQCDGLAADLAVSTLLGTPPRDEAIARVERGERGIER